MTAHPKRDAATILCLCTGNYCRSPLAEGLLRYHLARHGGDQFRVISAGTTGHHAGKLAAPAVVRALHERGANDFTHIPHPITPDEVAQADLILAMAAEHRDWIAQYYPEALPRTMLLSEAIGQSFDIPDPGVDYSVKLEQVVDLIERCVREGMDVITARARTRQP
jgi:protein-tyrosine phosphatase